MRCSIILISVVCSLAGCKKGASTEGGAGSGSAAAAAPVADPLQELAAKENAYVDCLNEFSGDVQHGRQIWMEYFAKGPSPKQATETLYGPLALPDVKKCKAGVDAAKSQPPAIPELEAAGAAYVAVLEKLVPLTKDLRAYFDAGNYKDDKLAHAIEVHPKLMAAYAEFDTASQAIEGQVDTLEDKIQADRLVSIEKREGKKLSYLHLAFLIASKNVVRRTGRLATPFDVDLPAYTAEVTAADQALTADMAYYDAHKAEVDQNGMSYWSFVNNAKEFVKDAKDLMRRKRDKEALSSGEKMTIEANNAEAVPGHPRRVGKSYNGMIESSNGLRW